MRLAVVSCLLAITPIAAQAADGPKLDISGDVRLRLEQDWDSQNAVGVEREERTRARLRLRLNGKTDLGSGFVARGRVRTTGANPGSANITFADFDGNPTDDFKVLVDQYSIAWQRRTGGVELGRMAFPFYTQNEYVWDNDIAVLGGSGNLTLHDTKFAKIKSTGGAFKLPAGITDYSGKLLAAQVTLERGPAVFAVGVFRFDADPNDRDALLLVDGNGRRDYTVLTFNGQYKLQAAGKPLVLSADYFHNVESYRSSSDPISRTHADDRDGFVLGVAWGNTNKPGNFLIGYRWFRMEKLAVNGSYAHDDAIRSGTVTDLRGHDLYASYAVMKELTFNVRSFDVERLSNREDGKRVRFDLIYKFN